MKPFILVLLVLTASPLFAADWTPVKDEATAQKLAPVTKRKLEAYRHGVKKEWRYPKEQQDTFVVIHPSESRKNAPLYVVLHSAGHNVHSCVKCTATVGNHDIYHSPDNFYALYLDCGANRGDWWWGANSKSGASTKEDPDADLTPVERRVIDTVKWTIKNYGIDPNRVYLCGNSMGGSGTLGIGLRNGDIFAAIKANVPAPVKHATMRMYFPPASAPSHLKFPDPPVTIDYSAPNDGWSKGHSEFAKAMNDRKYPFYLYWGPFGHANNHSEIMEVNDLINSFDWLSVKKNEAYAVFSNASSNDPLPWPVNLKEKAPGQINAWFRWKVVEESKEKVSKAVPKAKKTAEKSAK